MLSKLFNLPWPPEFFLPQCPCCADDEDTPWSGGQATKLYLQSGQFTSTLKTSEDVSAIASDVDSISWDGTNTPWSGSGDKLYLQSGQFTSTLKTSEDIQGINEAHGISWDGTNTPWTGTGLFAPIKLYLQSGQFTSTIKTSLWLNPGKGGHAYGISWDGTNTPWTSNHGGGGTLGDWLVLQSGQFTSTIKTSLKVDSIDTGVHGISWDGTNTPWTGLADLKLYLQSGQFTSTLKTSEYVAVIDNDPEGINTNKRTTG